MAVSEDGARLVSVKNGITLWDAAEQSTGLTRAYREDNSCVYSAAAVAVKNTDLFTFLSQPCKLCMRNATVSDAECQNSLKVVRLF
eukprot:SAG31_NODE_39186_length_290_cov_0.816754_1_plen_86_part_10